MAGNKEDGLYSRFSRISAMFYTQPPSGVELAARFVGNIMENIQTQIRVDRYLVPTKSHTVTTQNQEEHLVAGNQESIEENLSVRNCVTIVSG